MPPTWKEVIGCHGVGWSDCGDRISSVCIPDSAPSPEGFRLCILREGEIDICPIHWRSGPTTYYEDIDDNRICTDCACGPPSGGMCIAKVSLDKNSDCSESIDQFTISSAKKTCIDVQPPGQPIMSKSSTPPVYVSGACKPVPGTSSGKTGGRTPSTFCCRSPT